MPVSSRARRVLLSGAATLAGAAVLFPGAILRGESFFERDLNVDWYQRLEVLARCVREGSWPVWDPSVGFGYPLLADPGAQILYPGAWLVYPLPTSIGYTVFVLGHLLLAAFGMAGLARALGAGRAGAVAAALLFALSGPMQSMVNLRHHLAGAAWMPWVLLGVDRVVRAPRTTTVLALAAAASLQVLAGSPDVSAMTLVLAAGWVLVRLAARLRRRRPTGGAVGAVLVCALLVVGITAMQWQPALDVLSRSSRRSLPEDVRTAWSIPVQGLWRTIVPLDPARVPFEPERWSRLFDRPQPPFLFSIYLGLPALVLGAAALVARRRRRRALVLLALLAGAVGFAMGPHAPLYLPLASAVPLLQIFRYPSKVMVVAALAAALLGGLGAGALGRGRLSPRRLALLAVLGLAAGVVAWAGGRSLGLAGWPLGSFLAAGASVVLALSAGARLSPRFGSTALVALAAADLLAAHSGLNATAPVGLVLDPPPTVALVDRSFGRRLYVYDYHSVPGAPERLLGRVDPYPSAAPPAGVDNRWYNFLARTLYLPAPSGGLFGLENSYDLDLRGLDGRDLNDLTFFLRRVEGTPVETRLLRMGAVGTVLSLHRRGFEGLRLERALPSLFPEPILVWRVPDAQPRSWVVGRTRVADGRAAFDALLDPGFEPSGEAVLAGGPGLAGSAPFAGTSRLLALHPDRVRALAEASAPGLLVLADAYDPGWTATVDGRPAPVLRANVAFRGVPVPAGRHEVEMVYRPRAVLRGLALTFASLLVACAALVVARRRA